jgi:hypothetical protein
VTRFYFQSSQPAAVAPAYSAQWNSTAEAARLRLVDAKVDSTNVGTLAWCLTSSAAQQFVLWRQYVSDPVEAQTIGGSIKGQLACLVNNNANGCTVAVRIRVVSNDGLAERGVLLEIAASGAVTTPPRFTDSGSEFENRKFKNAAEETLLALTDVEAEGGDRIVVEIGFREVTDDAFRLARVLLGDAAAIDLPEDESSRYSAKQSTPSGWIEFNPGFSGASLLEISGPSTFETGSIPLPEFVASGGLGAAEYEWSASGGTFNVDSGVDTVEWTPPEGAFGTYVITVTDGEQTASVEITVVGEASLVPSYPVDFEVRRKVLPSQSEKLTRESVTKSQHFLYFNLNFNARKPAEYDAVQALWDLLYPNPEQGFLWDMPHLNASGVFLFDSEIRLVRSFHQRNDFAFSIRRHNPLTIIVPGSNVLPRAPDYTTEVQPTKQVLVSDSPANSRAAEAVSETKLPLNLVFRNLYLSHVQTLIHFWAYHFPKRQIVYTDPWTGSTKNYWIDSDFKGQFKGLNWVECSFAIREV